MNKQNQISLVTSTLMTFAFLTSLLLIGCKSTVNWQEEVKLRTGETITIDRKVEHAGGGAAWPHGQGTVPKHHLIRFRYPPNTGPLIEWHSTKFDMPRASWAELPLVLDLSTDNTWFIYTMQWVNDYCIRYVKYQFQQGVWAEIPWSEEPIDVHETNLYLGAGSNDLEGLISLGTKYQENTSAGWMWFFKKVGPKQVIPEGDGLGCEWEPNAQVFNVKRINGDKR